MRRVDWQTFHFKAEGDDYRPLASNPPVYAPVFYEDVDQTKVVAASGHWVVTEGKEVYYSVPYVNRGNPGGYSPSYKTTEPGFKTNVAPGLDVDGVRACGRNVFLWNADGQWWWLPNLAHPDIETDGALTIVALPSKVQDIQCEFGNAILVRVDTGAGTSTSTTNPPTWLPPIHRIFNTRSIIGTNGVVSAHGLITTNGIVGVTRKTTTSSNSGRCELFCDCGCISFSVCNPCGNDAGSLTSMMPPEALNLTVFTLGTPTSNVLFEGYHRNEWFSYQYWSRRGE